MHRTGQGPPSVYRGGNQVLTRPMPHLCAFFHQSLQMKLVVVHTSPTWKEELHFNTTSNASFVKRTQVTNRRSSQSGALELAGGQWLQVNIHSLYTNPEANLPPCTRAHALRAQNPLTRRPLEKPAQVSVMSTALIHQGKK